MATVRRGCGGGRARGGCSQAGRGGWDGRPAGEGRGVRGGGRLDGAGAKAAHYGGVPGGQRSVSAPRGQAGEQSGQRGGGVGCGRRGGAGRGRRGREGRDRAGRREGRRAGTGRREGRRAGTGLGWVGASPPRRTGGGGGRVRGGGEGGGRAPAAEERPRPRRRCPCLGGGGCSACIACVRPPAPRPPPRRGRSRACAWYGATGRGGADKTSSRKLADKVAARGCGRVCITRADEAVAWGMEALRGCPRSGVDGICL